VSLRHKQSIVDNFRYLFGCVNVNGLRLSGGVLNVDLNVRCASLECLQNSAGLSGNEITVMSEKDVAPGPIESLVCHLDIIICARNSTEATRSLVRCSLEGVR